MALGAIRSVATGNPETLTVAVALVALTESVTRIVSSATAPVVFSPAVYRPFASTVLPMELSTDQSSSGGVLQFSPGAEVALKCTASVETALMAEGVIVTAHSS